ncbi:MAG: hypothetical protein H6738_18640 [Alphaproteobacteria bacterium]|nr:hypothetical protein [Alphaproteobacteria bacterium]
MWLLLPLIAGAEPASTGRIEGSVTLPASARSQTWAWIDGDGPLPDIPDTVALAQEGTEFFPKVLVIPRGTVVDFPNRGPDMHEVHWVTRQYTDTLGIYRAGESEQRTFEEVGEYPIGCNRHENMAATIRVVPNRWLVKVDRDGGFVLDELPAGTWHVVVWSPAGHLQVERDVEVKAGASARFSARLD